MKIELILLGVIGLVFLVDFVMNSRKKPSIDNVVDQIEGGEASKKKLNNKLNASIKVLFAQIIINILITLWIVFFQDSNFSDQLYGKFIIGYQAYNYFYYLINILFVPLYILANNSQNSTPNYILKRKKNFTLFIISIPLIKVLLHYLLYPIMKQDRLVNSRVQSEIVNSEKYRASLGEHLDVMFTDEIWLFIPTFILVSLLVWFFNDKIKAR
jgi:hypothetical protein